MKEHCFMVFFIGVLILANILVFFLNVNTTFTLMIVIAVAALYKAFISEKFSDIYNIHSFKFTLNSNNILEIAGAFLVGLIACNNIHDFNIIDFFIFIIVSLFIYRFLFFNLSKKISKMKA